MPIVIKYAAVAIIAWAILAAFYFSVRLRFILVAHSLTPLIAIIFLLIHFGLAVSTGALVSPGPFALFVTSCRVTSIVVFPLTILRLIERHSKERSSPR